MDITRADEKIIAKTEREGGRGWEGKGQRSATHERCRGETKQRRGGVDGWRLEEERQKEKEKGLSENNELLFLGE